MKKIYLISGISLILLGIVLLIINLGLNPVSLIILWPIFPILIGFLFVSFYYMDKTKNGFIMPGVILILTGIAFFFCTLTNWSNMQYLWPIFILAPGVGFFFNYFAGKKESFQLTWGFILTIVALIFFFVRSELQILYPIVFIILGLIFVFLYVGKRESSE